MDFNQRFHAANLAIEQGLQSTSLPDVLSAIMDTPAYIEQMPFPVFVNTVLLRLAEAFQGEKLSAKLEQFVNMTRLRIVKSVKEFSHHLHVAFSGEEIVRRIMKVSHSNDFYARSLTLLLLAALAPLISENKKVHHLLIESLDCDEDTELQSAIFAITEFGKYSSAFPSIVLEKLSEVLCSNDASTEVKIRLLNVISNFKENYAVTSNCLALGKDLLKQNCDLHMQLAVYNSTTALASRSSLAIPDQISTLLDALSESFSNKALALGLFRDICKLARFPQHWKSAQVTTLRDFYPRLTEMNSDRVIESWLEAMQNLTSSGLYVDILSGDKGGPWIQLLSGENLKLRISCAQLVRNLLTSGEAEHFQGLLLSAISATIGDIRATTETQNKVRFYKFVGIFARLPQCFEKNAVNIVQSLVEHIPSMQTSHLSDLGLLLQTLCAICDDHPKCGSAVSRWTIEKFLKAPIENVGIFPMELFSLMFASWNGDSREQILERLLKAPVNRWTLYKIARVALRYGHWKSMAVPILEKVKECCESMETSSWISALISISRGQVTGFTVASIGESYGILKKSVVMLEVRKNFYYITNCCNNQ
ncbi:integrator complex subunit 7 [Ditylenchus destructor]|nr:integrator complex subunit 7 [Ditylenchus destructor]